MTHLPLWLLLAIFVVGAAAIWVAGIQLSKTTDVLDARFKLGSALGGLIVLAIATNLPETAITVTAAVSGRIEVATGNILGGIALQTVVIAVLDLFGKRRARHPLMYRAASLTLIIEAALVVAVLAVVVAGTRLPSSLVFLRVSPAGVLILAVWIVGLLLVRKAKNGLPWDRRGEAPGKSNSSNKKSPTMSARRAGIVFAIAALVTLGAGVAVEQAGDAAAGQLGLSGVVFGATVLALATSLPEISTGIQAIRQGDDTLAVSDIFGGNAFLPVLFLVATLISGKAVLPQAQGSDVYLTAVAMLLTLVYLVAIVFRPTRKVLGMGVDSLTVVAIYAVSLLGLAAISLAH